MEDTSGSERGFEHLGEEGVVIPPPEEFSDSAIIGSVEEYEALYGRRGYWLEKAVVPVVLRLSSSSPRPAPPPPAPAVPGYREALKPYIKTMSFFAGGTQMIVLIATSFAGAPGWALLYSVASNVGFLPLLPRIARAHRRALAAGAAPGPLR